MNNKELLPGEINAMLNFTIYMWSLVGFRYEDLTIEQQRLITPKRFKSIIAYFKNQPLVLKSRINMLLLDKQVPNFEEEVVVVQPVQLELEPVVETKITAEDKLDTLVSGLSVLLASLKK